jgi:hypothetical protein
MIDFNQLIFNNLTVSQGSLLSSFLFNIYFTELDKFVKKLKVEIFMPIKYKSQKKAIFEFRSFQKKFSDVNKFDLVLKKHGSPELGLVAYKKEKKVFYKKYGYGAEAELLFRNLFYIRYADNFLAGFHGPKLFAVKMTHQINTFIQKDLQLKFKSTKLINRNKTGVKFLGFIVYLPQLKKKAMVKTSQIKSVKKYIARSKARVAAGLVKNSKAFFYALRHDIVASLKQINIKSDKNISQLENLIESKFTLRLGNLKYNKEKRLEIANHFKELFSKNFALALKSFNDNFKPFIYNKEFQCTEMAFELNAATKNFLKVIKKIEAKVKDNWLANRRRSAIEQYKQKFVSKNSVWPLTSHKEFMRMVNLLSLQVFSVKMTHKISMIFSLKDFYNKLRKLGYIHPKKNCSIGKTTLINFADHEIIKYFNRLICGYLYWFRCADNVNDVKKIWYILVKSCLFTLARKHKKNFS